MYTYTKDMQEISGFGGRYEEACRKMIVAGLKFWDQQTDPIWDSFESLFISRPVEENSDTKMLETAVGASESGCSGAQVGAAMSHIMFIKKQGQGKYVEEMVAEKVWFEELKIIAGKHGESVEGIREWSDVQSPADAFYEKYPEHRE